MAGKKQSGGEKEVIKGSRVHYQMHQIAKCTLQMHPFQTHTV